MPLSKLASNVQTAEGIKILKRRQRTMAAAFTLAGRGQRNTAHKLAQSFGWLSIGLGVTEIVAPHVFGRLAGLSRKPSRTMGVQKLASGLGLIANPQRSLGFWTRVGTDILGWVGLRRSLRAQRTPARKPATIAAVSGAAVLGAAGIRKLAARGNSHRSIRHSSSIAVSRTPEECYRYWRDFQKLPLFFKNLKEIHGDGDGRLHWVARGPDGKEIPWTMDLTEDVPGHTIAWRSVGDSRITESGSVRFEPIGGGKGTIVRLHVQHDLPFPMAARVISSLLGSD